MWFLYISSYFIFSIYLKVPIGSSVLERFISTNIVSTFTSNELKTSIYVFVLTFAFFTSINLLLISKDSFSYWYK